MKDFVDNHVRTCHICQRVKSERKSSRGKIQPFLIQERKWQAIHIDWVLGVPTRPPDVGTYDAVLTITDRATKMVHFVATKRTEKATDTASYPMQHVVKAHGLPRSIICDRDSKFLSLFWPSVMQLMGISTGERPGRKNKPDTSTVPQGVRENIRRLAGRSHDRRNGHQ